jgi:hypothetical protein
MLDITIVDALPCVGGLVRDGFQTINNTLAAKAEAGHQHGFWDNNNNIFALLENFPTIENVDDVLKGYAEQGQYPYLPKGLEAVWPVYRNSKPQLPTGISQALYTKFTNLVHRRCHWYFPFRTLMTPRKRGKSTTPSPSETCASN